MSVQVPFLDVVSEFGQLADEWFHEIREVGATGRFILGPNVEAFEREAAEYVGCSHAIGVANGTDALILALRALGIGPGDEVITSPFTFFASAESISVVGATPVFADIDADTFNISPATVEPKITPRTKAILPVHIFGCPADMTGLNALASAHNLRVIEDSAQAFGAEHGGKRVCGIGDFGCTSFYPTKVLGGYGDGGMVFLNDAEMDAYIRRFRNHGASGNFMHDTVGTNSRLDEIQAALLRIKLRDLESAVAGRERVAAVYDAALAGIEQVTAPPRPQNGRHAFNLYTIRAANRDALREHLNAHQIPSNFCYPLSMHLQEVYRDLGGKAGDLPVVEQTCTETLSLPIFPTMSDEQVARVAEVVSDFYA
jgi:dTDP-4-amino-4,6-dideoxygalactose transaminase